MSNALLKDDDFDLMLDKLKLDYTNYRSRVLLFIANDVDALCAQHILTVCYCCE
jgi:hypothetical protein